MGAARRLSSAHPGDECRSNRRRERPSASSLLDSVHDVRRNRASAPRSCPGGRRSGWASRSPPSAIPTCSSTSHRGHGRGLALGVFRFCDSGSGSARRGGPAYPRASLVGFEVEPALLGEVFRLRSPYPLLPLLRLLRPLRIDTERVQPNWPDALAIRGFVLPLPHDSSSRHAVQATETPWPLEGPEGHIETVRLSLGTATTTKGAAVGPSRRSREDPSRDGPHGLLRRQTGARYAQLRDRLGDRLKMRPWV